MQTLRNISPVGPNLYSPLSDHKGFLSNHQVAAVWPEQEEKGYVVVGDDLFLRYRLCNEMGKLSERCRFR